MKDTLDFEKNTSPVGAGSSVEGASSVGAGAAEKGTSTVKGASSVITTSSVKGASSVEGTSPVITTSSVKRAAKTKSPALVIMQRELKSYFSSPIAYIVTGLFTLASGFLFFSTFFLANRAELRQFFALLPVLLSFFIPALSMRAFSEEKKSTSLETLLTLPVTVLDVVAGKFLAVFVSALALFVPSLFYVATCFIFGSPDAGPIFTGYLGTFFLTAGFSAIGLFASSTTKNQIIAFFEAFAICIVLTLLSNFAVFLPGAMVRAVTYLSSLSHFESICRGIIDSRDIVYFVSLTAVFFVLTVRSIKEGQN
ncbi:ABC transporter permease [uncultured Treponema sp.]|uniref:ABC transporter permease n=1 Tax=uncultured Treponema sp. TaxID=162155 RepID=UPI00280AC177|nr:ABC transporter permease [uncultured Treponema sp.]